MTVRDFLLNITIILTVMAAGARIETAVPMFVVRPLIRGRRAANLGLTALSFLLNWLLASLAAIAALALRPAQRPEEKSAWRSAQVGNIRGGVVSEGADR